MTERSGVEQIFWEQAQALALGGEVLPGGVEELAKKLQTAAEKKQPLRVKLGLDPTRPDLHIGHTVVLRKLRAFQDLGHEAILIIGDATAMIGDPSGRSQTRPPLTEEEIKVNAQTYLDQAGKVIDVRKAQIVYNSKWLGDLQLGDFLKLAAKVTVAQILVRDDFSKRYNENKPISLHELFYPLMQGYDSVVVEADIELGGTDQRFNNLIGRDLQVAYGAKKAPQMVLLMPLLEGTDGKIKMSKSYPDHCINLTDTPEDMFGKVMSVPDELLARYQALLTPVTEAQLKEQINLIGTGQINPRDIKVHLGKWLVAQYYSMDEAEAAERHFATRFQKREFPDDAPQITLPANQALGLVDLIVDKALAPSRSEARRLIQGGGVKLDGAKVEDIELQINRPTGNEANLQVGKRRFLKLLFA